MALSVTKIRALTTPGRHPDGNGLYLYIGKSGNRSWVQRIVIDGKRRDIGLGRYPDTTLGQARSKCADNRQKVYSGLNPLAAKQAVRQAAVEAPTLPTFKQLAERYIGANAPTWRHYKTAGDTRARLAAYAYPVFGDTPVDRITRTDVLAALSPIWTDKPAASRKLRQRVRAVFAYAMAHRSYRR